MNFFLGFEATKRNDGYYLTQRKYTVDLFTKTNMLTANGSLSPLCQSKKLSKDGGKVFENAQLYRFTIGALQYLTFTRPAIAFTVNKLRCSCKRLLRYLKETLDRSIQFNNGNALDLVFFSDAD